MKTISLRDVKNGLKRDEMRAISGGGCGSQWNCTCGTNATGKNLRVCSCEAYCNNSCSE